MIPIPHLFMCWDLRRCNSPSRCWVVFGQMCKTTCCENSIPQRVFFFFVGICDALRKQASFFPSRMKRQTRQMPQGGSDVFSQHKTFPKTDPYQAIWEGFKAGSVDDMRFSHPSWKHLLLPGNGALLWIILLGTPQIPKYPIQNPKPNIQTFGLHCRCWNFGSLDYWRFTEGIWDATS